MVHCPFSSCPSSVHIFQTSSLPKLLGFKAEPFGFGAMKVCSRHLGHITKIAATSIYGKITLFFTGTVEPISTIAGI